MRKLFATLAIAFPMAACTQPETNTRNELLAENRAAAPVNAGPEIAPGETGRLVDDRNLVEDGPINPKSGQGAEQVVQSYAALLEQGRFDEARRLWTDGGAGSGLSQDGFAEAYTKYTEIHAEIGATGPIEGAAGSAYVEIPLRFYGRLKGGRTFNSAGTATLRRANDVPGSTDEQRRWHIYRIEVQPPL